MCDVADPGGLTVYELERQQRMVENAQRLQALGLLQSAQELRTACADAQGRGPSAKKRGPTARAVDTGAAEGEAAEEAAPRRRLRSAGPLPEDEARASPREGAPGELPVRRSVPAPRIVSEDAEDYNEHNTHRLTTMSDKALLLRIKRIRNVAKMQSFIVVLQQNQRLDLAEVAQQALCQLT